MTKMVNKNSSCRILFAVLLAAVMLTGGKASSTNDDPLAKHPPGRMAVSILWFENRAGADAEYWRHGLKGSLSEAMKQVRAIRLCHSVGYTRRELSHEKIAELLQSAQRKRGSRPVGRIEGNKLIHDDGDVGIKIEPSGSTKKK